jgi:hypothetical protein
VESEAQGRTLIIVFDKLNLSFLLSCCISLWFFSLQQRSKQFYLATAGQGHLPGVRFRTFTI